MTFSIVLCVLLIFVTGISAGSVKWKDCGSTANVTEMRVTGCTQQPCVFYKNQEYSIEVDAVAPAVTPTLPYKVTAHIIFDVTLLKGNACDNLKVGKCPTETGKMITYKSPTIRISKTFPSISTTIRAIVLDDQKTKLICVELKSKIKSSVKYKYGMMPFPPLLHIGEIQVPDMINIANILYHN